MSTMSALGGFGWEGYGTDSGYCMVVDSRDVFPTGRETILETWATSSPGGQGYDPVCDCYCWGYMPAPMQIIGLSGGASLGATPLAAGVINNAVWRICDPRYTSNNACCPQPDAGTDCPTCPPVPPPPKTTLTAAQQTLGGKYGVTLGWLLAAGVIGGGGYYAYKKGVFKKKGRRKRR